MSLAEHGSRSMSWSSPSSSRRRSSRSKRRNYTRSRSGREHSRSGRDHSRSRLCGGHSCSRSRSRHHSGIIMTAGRWLYRMEFRFRQTATGIPVPAPVVALTRFQNRNVLLLPNPLQIISNTRLGS